MENSNGSIEADIGILGLDLSVSGDEEYKRSNRTAQDDLVFEKILNDAERIENEMIYSDENSMVFTDHLENKDNAVLSMNSTFDINSWVKRVQSTLDKIKLDEVPKITMDLGPDFDNIVKKILEEPSSEGSSIRNEDSSSLQFESS